MAIKWNEYTWYSKLAAVIFFILILPLWTYYLWTQYQDTQALLLTTSKTFTPISSVLPQNIHEQTSVVGDIKYVDKEFGDHTMPQITEFPDKAIIEKVNDQLFKIATTFSCQDDANPSPNNSYDASTKVSYAKNNIFSVSIHVGYFCGGPYPTNDWNQSVTFDMTTGEVVGFKELFKNYKRDRKAIMAIIFAKQIKETAGPSEDDGSCNGTYSLDNVGSTNDALDYSNDISYSVDGDGITAQPNFPHVMEACSELAHVSAEKLKGFFATSSILSRIK